VIRFATFLALFFALVSRTSLSLADATLPMLYWSQGPYSYRSTIQGADVQKILNEGFGDIAIDQGAGVGYLTSGDGVRLLNLSDGSQSSLYSESDYVSFLGIALDSVRNQLYFVDNYKSILYRINTDGSDLTTIIPTDGKMSGIVRIGQVEVDPNAGKLYWTYGLQSLLRSNLDGSGQELLFSTDQFLQDIELDLSHGKVYWTSSTGSKNGGSVYRANLDGTQQETLVDHKMWTVDGLALDVSAGKMYFTDGWATGGLGYNSKILSSNLDGSNLSMVLNLGPEYLPWNLAIKVPEPCSAALPIVPVTVIAVRRKAHKR
jgi:hypothetical protein